MFVLSHSHKFTTRNGILINIPKGTEVYPTGWKLLWDKTANGRKTARYYIKQALLIAGHEKNWYEVSGLSFSSHKVSKVSRKSLQQWKTQTLDCVQFI